MVITEAATIKKAAVVIPVPVQSAGYKQTELGIIPDDWTVFELSDLSIQITDGEHLTPKRSRSGYYLLSARNILNGQVDLSDVDFVGEDEYQRIRRRCAPDVGDVLISCSGTIGRVAVVPPGLNCVMVRSAALIKPNRKITNEFYLQYFLQHTEVQRQIQETLNRGAQPNLFLNHIEKLRVALPPTLDEQVAIVRALRDTDAHIESLNKLIEKKRRIKQGVMQELLSGRRRLPGASGEWDKRPFGEVFNFLPTATNSRADLGEDGDAYYVHYGDIHTRFHHHLDFKTQKPPRIELEKCPAAALLRNGDWIMADASEDTAGVGKSVEVRGLEEDQRAVSGLHTFLLRERYPIFTPGFKGHLGEAEFLRKQYLRVMTGMKVFGVSKTALRELLIQIPSSNEQAALVEVFDDMSAEIVALEIRYEKARKIKKGMMQELLTGRVRLV